MENVLGKLESGICPLCQHPPIRHVEDGLGGATCIVCLFLRKEDWFAGLRPREVCTVKFQFKLSRSEREQAQQASKTAYPPRTICASCEHYWEGHYGYLCPSGDSTFIPLLEKDQPFLITH